ncbi:alginate export family protein [Luteolibacter algae]|uniref:Alginate export family protein n=1 Tax=Luteolibacter algae TaxID=454151 RepID=A0ABW5DAY9_9BACT
MKKFAVLSLFPAFAIAGTPIEESATSESPPWATPSLDIRARYEFGDVDGLDPSHAFSFRERLGLTSRSWNGLSAFVEGEFTQSAVDDYNGGAPGVDPGIVGNSVIADPETNELNQAYIQYQGFETTSRVGRQRIIYDNAAFIGNVGWRQNEQTYDAISLRNSSISGLTLQYAYINQVNRIFGSDATGFAGDVGSRIHLINASYDRVEGYTLGAYAYLMDFDGPNVWDNNTYGVSAKTNLLGLDLFGEMAFQNEAGTNSDDESNYAHLSVAKSMETHTFTAGLEYLSSGFRTPLATLHAFNGYADVFLGQRLAGATGGLTDAYLSHSMPLAWGVKMTNTFHAFGDNGLSTARGWEIDSVLAKKFDEHFLAIAKLAHFETESAIPTTTRFSLELNYSF